MTKTPAPGARRGLAPGDALEFRVEKGVYRGLGLARHEGQVVFIPRALPGDLLRARIESARAGYAEGVALALVEGGPGRRPSPCPYVPRCGGCAYQELAYSGQLALKRGILEESLLRAGAPWSGEITVAPSPEEGWRTRASLHLAVEGGRLALGLRREGTREVVDLPRCLQLSERMNRAARGLKGALEGRADLWRRLKGVDLAESPSGDALVAAVDADLDAQAAPSLAFLAEGAPGLSGLGVLTGGRHRHFLSLRGSPYVRTEVLGVPMRAHVRSFFQGNRFLLEPLARTVVDLVPPGGPVLDLYAGVGLFALPLAARGEEVVAMELGPSAAEDAAANARQVRFGRVRVVKCDVREGLRSWPRQGEERIVLDPPRTGAGPAVVAAIVERRPQAVVYVSCDPPTLGRDLAAFSRAGYRADRLVAFDLFPDTFHLETVVRLVPAA
ncbi:MAG TPA: TRAM domain-containing protein [Vicinamibacteria bacterium]|nr:TRAM domain-containing protein [Vicinamibacteria bacterium]